MVATIVTSPPRPPSPPLGPPRGTYFSRRKARHPLPPSPAFRVILTSSTNIKNLVLFRGASFSLRRASARQAGTRKKGRQGDKPGGQILSQLANSLLDGDFGVHADE